MKKIILILFLSILIVSCAQNTNEDGDLGKLNGECRADSTCNNDFVCLDNECVTKEDGCKFITCIGDDGKTHGQCIVENSRAVCDCDQNYERVNNTKCNLISEDETCENIICSGNDGKSHGSCDVKSGKAICTCNDGYEVQNNNLNCIAIESATECKEDSCSGKAGSKCVLEAGKVNCICKDGYKEDSEGDCLPQIDYFCKDIICDENKNMTGLCKIEEVEDSNGVTSVSTYCECEAGWFGKLCDESNTPDCSICETDTNSTGDCYIDQQDPEKTPVCICKEGFLYDIDNGCISEEEKKSGNIKSQRIKTGSLNNKCFKNNACLSGLICSNESICKKADKITKNTIVITKEESATQLIKLDKNKLTFSKNERTSLFKKGNILAFRETKLLPNGFIGKIKKVELVKNNVVLTTEEISPFEILANVQLNIDENIEFNTPIDPYTSNIGNSINKVLSYNNSFYGDTFKIIGDMSIKYNFTMLIDIQRDASRKYNLAKFDMTNNIDLINNLKLNLNVVSFTNEKIKIPSQGTTLFSNQKISTFTVYLPYGIKTLGEIYLSVKALYAGNLQGIADLKIKTTSNFKSIIKYENNRTIKTNDYNTQKDILEENINVDGSAGITFKVVPEVRFRAYSTTVTNNIKMGTEVVFTPVLLNSTLDSSFKSCYSLKGVASLNTYAVLDMMKTNRDSSGNGINISWNKDAIPKIKDFNWLNRDKKCKDFTCLTDEDCRINQRTMASTCNQTCVNNSSNIDYEFVEIPESDFVRGCVGTGTE